MKYELVFHSLETGQVFFAGEPTLCTTGRMAFEGAINCGTSIQMINQHSRNTIDDQKAVAAFWGLKPAKLLAKAPDVVIPSKPKIAWPKKESLKKLVWQKPLMHAATEIGVSDVALRKHCVKLGIDLPPRGHWLRERRDQAV